MEKTKDERNSLKEEALKGVNAGFVHMSDGEDEPLMTCSSKSTAKNDDLPPCPNSRYLRLKYDCYGCTRPIIAE